MPELVPLAHLAAGQSAHIGHVSGQVSEVQRLNELGLREGVMLKMIQSGTPCIVQLADNRLCFRQSEAFSVLVRPGGLP